MLWKCCTQYASIFGKLSSGHGTGKGQFSFQSQRKAMPFYSQLHSSQFSSVQSFSRVQLLWPHGVHHASPPYPSPTPGVYPNSCPLSQGCHPSHASKLMLKFLQARLQRYMSRDFQSFKLDLEKAEEPEIKSLSVESSKKRESSRKTPPFPLLITPKPLTVWITKNCGTFLKTWEYQNTWPASWEICMQVEKQQLELHMEQTGSS